MNSDSWGTIRARARDTGRSFEYQVPTQIVFGRGRIAEIGEQIRRLCAHRPLIVTDAGVRDAGIIDRIGGWLKSSGLSVEVFDRVESDPPVASVEHVRDLMIDQAYDLAIGVGGGSALDVAKAASALVTNPGDPRVYVGRDRIVEQPLPVIAVPTTAGTGSEVTMWSVLTDTQSGAKVSIGSMKMVPRVALLDPELTYGLPPAITAATGMDALSHAVESYGSVWNHAIAESLALRAIGMVGQYLRRAVRDGSDEEARQGMLLASTISELAANSTRLGVCHALAIPLGARHHVPHGVANAILLGPVADFNSSADHDRYRTIARALDGSEDAGVAISRLREDVGIAGDLSAWSVGPNDNHALAEMAMHSDNVQANPREADLPELIRILESVETGGLELTR